MKTKIPLVNRIKKESHRQIASAQDLIVEELLKIIPEAVFSSASAGSTRTLSANGLIFTFDILILKF